MGEKEKLMENPLIGEKIKLRFEHEKRLKAMGIDQLGVTSDIEENFIRLINSLTLGLKIVVEKDDDEEFTYYEIQESEYIDDALTHLSYIYFNVFQGFERVGRHQRLSKLWTETEDEKPKE